VTYLLPSSSFNKIRYYNVRENVLRMRLLRSPTPSLHDGGQLCPIPPPFISAFLAVGVSSSNTHPISQQGAAGNPVQAWLLLLVYPSICCLACLWFNHHTWKGILPLLPKSCPDHRCWPLFNKRPTNVQRPLYLTFPLRILARLTPAGQPQEERSPRSTQTSLDANERGRRRGESMYMSYPHHVP
jgi:hypothetical protein